MTTLIDTLDKLIAVTTKLRAEAEGDIEVAVSVDDEHRDILDVRLVEGKLGKCLIIDCDLPDEIDVSSRLVDHAHARLLAYRSQQQTLPFVQEKKTDE